MGGEWRLQEQRNGQQALSLCRGRGQATRGMKKPHKISLCEGQRDLNGCYFTGTWRDGGSVETDLIKWTIIIRWWGGSDTEQA